MLYTRIEIPADSATETAELKSKPWNAFELASTADSPRVFTTFLAEPKELLPEPIHQVLALEYHLERLIRDAKAISIYDERLPAHQPGQIRNWLKQVLRRAAKERPSTTPLKTRILIDPSGAEFTAEEYAPPWSDGKPIRLQTVSMERPSPSHKTSLVQVCRAARSKAEVLGANEALLIDTAGNIREGAWSNLFWFKKSGELCTISNNALPGITQRIILENESCRTEVATIQRLINEAAEVFITQSTTGITPVNSIDGVTISSAHPLTEALRTRFQGHKRALYTVL